MIPEDRLDGILARAQTLQDEMNANCPPERFVALSKEFAEVDPVVQAIQRYRQTLNEISDLQGLMDGDDADMRELAEVELPSLQERLPELEDDLQILLLPKDAADRLDVILEVRAGTGGDEAALFAGNLFRMYQRYADIKGWTVEMISHSDGDMGGYKEVIASVRGTGVFAEFKFESGVHRVQRVPDTESSGRIHTSAATVAVMPEPEEVDIQIEDKDIRVDVFRASGPGGQSVNTTDSAVRITHIESGLVVIQQDEKSQHKNRAKAMKVLRARLFEAERDRIDSERAADRKSKVGTGDRSERIRTYNYPQGRVTDHRINLTLHKLEKVLEGEALGELVSSLISEDQMRRLSAQSDDGI
ncbi:peptide chain release factor 1 [Alphaproteobacteria bacterium]|jgi:peptide chain release factor 1|nr:peptide chain release factor 1 [Alphaproteobacteria bacterium]